jgi:hypothetical protein
VVRVSATVELESADGKIDPENRTCSLLSGTKVACLSLQGCLLYEGEAVTEELGESCFFIFLWPMPLFLISTHKQCILSHFIHNSSAMFP